MKDNFKPFVSHENIAVLLDAYQTDELEQSEREQVVQHLQGCPQCQQVLVEIQHIRRQFAPFTIYNEPIQHDKSQQSERQSSIFADDVMKKIFTKESGARNMQRSHDKRQTKRWGWYIGMAAVLCAVIFVIFTITLHNTQQPPRVLSSIGAPPHFWDVRDEQMTIKNNDITFAIKNITFTQQEFQFFYAMRSSPTLHIHVTSTVNNTGEISLQTHDQPLGKLGVYTIGVLHIHRIDRLNQVLTIQVTTPEHPTPWNIKPLKQLFVDNKSNERGDFFVGQNNFPDITWYGPLKIEQVAFFKDTSNKNVGPDAPHIFVRLDTPNVVSTISKAEYLSIAGQENYS